MSDSPELIPFMGSTFAPPEKFRSRRYTTLMREMQNVDASSSFADALVADLVDLFVRKQDMQRFDDLCDETGATIEEQMLFVQAGVEVVFARPTSRSSDSSDGPPTTGTVSTPPSSSPEPLYASRPDLQLLVMQAERAQAAQAS